MTEFWNSLLTEKSWNLLIELGKKDFKFIVIGGWAAYLFTKQHKSKDIDIVLPNIKELDYLKTNYNLKKNDNLRKYEIQFEEIDLDIYVPYYSRLAIPVEDIKNYSIKIQSFDVVKPAVLLILKQGAELDRQYSVKGQKDQIDIMSILCYGDVDLKLYFSILKKYKLEHLFQRLKSIVMGFKDHSYLDLNPRELKLKKKEILEKLGRRK